MIITYKLEDTQEGGFNIIEVDVFGVEQVVASFDDAVAAEYYLEMKLNELACINQEE